MFKINLGSKIESIVTAQMGVVVSRSENLGGCNRYFVQPKVDKEGKVPDGSWIDEGEINVLDPNFVKVGDQTTGGPPSGVR